MKKKINDKYVSMVWQTLSEDPGMSNSILNLNMNNPETISTIVNERIFPGVNSFPEFIKDRIKNSLKYAINVYDEKKLTRLYESAIPEIDLPTNISVKDFYIIIWKSLYNNSDYLIENESEYKEIDFSELYSK
ncbi:hypothetical protein D781_2815 [Serratia sp. FGI94]|uniref:hypothetical protein n=1 Tax=Serratia sp. FGI94 TaxID=671990 RepID=UPI0002A70B8E|nr:hypothetical protein [Serratia sp. FGI94]AGB83060.1 hypothetical protein D781_2815 [Serratia sp. FGI94]